MAKKVQDKVEKVIAKVRPYIQTHGGDVEVVCVKKGVVTLKISGACAHCSMADLTYNKLIGGLLKEEVPELKGLILEK